MNHRVLLDLLSDLHAQAQQVPVLLARIAELEAELAKRKDER